MKRLTLLFLFIASSAVAQYKLGKVSVQELSEKVHAKDTSAPAAIIFKKVDVSFTTGSNNRYMLNTETMYKIKVYKKEGYSYATWSFPYKSGSNADQVSVTDAATYNLVDGKVERIKLKNEGEFREETTKDYKTFKITLPNVKEGSILEFRVVQTSYNLVDIGKFYFQYDVPVEHVDFRFTFPEHFQYNTMIGGYLSPKFNNENLTGGVMGDMRRISTELDKIPAMIDESFVNNIQNYRSRIEIELAAIRKSNGTIEEFASSWEAVTKNLYEIESFGPELKKSGYFEEDLKLILAKSNSDEQKVQNIYNFVKNKMTWNERNGIVCEDGVRSAYKSGKGNVAEINFILTAMLREAKLDANPVMVSTRNHGIALFPSRTGFNYIVSAVELNGKTVLLDATEPYSKPNLIPMRCLNWVGQLIRKDGTYKSIDLMPKFISKDNISLSVQISNDGKVSGKARRALTDYNAYNYRNNYSRMNKDAYIEKLETNHAGLEVNEHEVKNLKELDESIQESYDFVHNNSVEIIGDKMYFSPMLFFTQTENPFKQEKREHPVDFYFPMQDKYTINIKLPDGYKVESLPKAGMYSTLGKETIFKYNIAQQDNNIQLVVSHDINTHIFGAEQYETLKTFFKEMLTKQGEKVVLKRI